MSLVREKDGRRLHVKSRLMGESLVSKSFIEGLPVAPQTRLYPDVNILKVGGNPYVIEAPQPCRPLSRKLL